MRHLQGLGIRERELERLLVIAGPHFAAIADGDAMRKACGSVIGACRRHACRVPLMSPYERRRFTYRKQIAAWAETAAATTGTGSPHAVSELPPRPVR